MEMTIRIFWERNTSRLNGNKASLLLTRIARNLSLQIKINLPSHPICIRIHSFSILGTCVMAVKRILSKEFAIIVKFAKTMTFVRLAIAREIIIIE